MIYIKDEKKTKISWREKWEKCPYCGTLNNNDAACVCVRGLEKSKQNYNNAEVDDDNDEKKNGN